MVAEQSALAEHAAEDTSILKLLPLIVADASFGHKRAPKMPATGSATKLHFTEPLIVFFVIAKTSGRGSRPAPLSALPRLSRLVNRSTEREPPIYKDSGRRSASHPFG